MGWGGNGLPRMVEGGGEAELEEGETFDDRSIDLERDFSYLDKRLQSLLGHHQKDFEGGVSAESLGSKFGGYGSFLPAYQRLPSIWSQPKSPQKVQTHNGARSPNYLHREGAAQNSTAITDAPSSQRNGTAVIPGLDSSREMMVPLGDGSARQDNHLSSAQVAEKIPKKHQWSPNKSLIQSDKKSLKFRIKVGSDRTTKKNAAIYSGLGLTSPSSTGNSIGESEGNLYGSQGTPDGPLSCILLMLTSVIVAGGLLVSPLPDDFLRLTSNIPKGTKPENTVKFKHNHFGTSANDSTSQLTDEDVLTRKQTEFDGKSQMCKESKHGNSMAFDDDIQSRLKDSFGAQMLQNEQCVSLDMTGKRQSEPLANVAESSWGSTKAVETFKGHENAALLSNREVSKAKVKNRFLGNELVKDVSFESMPGQSSAKFEHREAKSGSVQMGKKSQTKRSQKDLLADHNDGIRSKAKISPASFKVDIDISEGDRDCKDDMDHLILKPSKRSTSEGQDERRMPRTAKKLSSESKKISKGAQVKGKVSLDLARESMGTSVSAAVQQKGMKRDANKARSIYKDLFEEHLESRSKAVDVFEGPSGDRSKESNFDTVKVKHSHDRIKGSKKFDNHVPSGTLLPNNPPSGCLPSNNGLTMTAELATVASVTIEDNWVCCDSCQKWRLLPSGKKPEQLPEKWLCSLLDWLPGMNRCDISEEETTRAVQISNHPVPANQLGIENYAIMPAIGVDPVRHLVNENNQEFSLDYLDYGKKKNPKTKDVVLPVGNAKNIQQDVLKRESSKDRKQTFVGANPNNKSSSQNPSNPEIAVKEHSDRQKQECVTIGDSKPKRKGKRESDQDNYEIPKRIKSEGAFDTINVQTSTVASKNDSRKQSDSYTNDVKAEERNGLQTSTRKSREEVQGLLGSGSLDMITKSDDREVPPKKRELNDWQNCPDVLKSGGSHSSEKNVLMKGESNDSGFRREKKPRMSKTDGIDSSRSQSNSELKRKEVSARMVSSTSKNTVDGKFDYPMKQNKYKVKITSQLTLEDLESLKKDLGCEQVSTAATSSSSKVSDSPKTRTSYRDVKGSPVESVSSSPMKMSNLNKLSPKSDVLGFHDVKVGDFSTNGSPRKIVAGDVNRINKQPGMAKRRKNSVVLKPESSDNPVLDFRVTDAGDKFHVECKAGVESSPFFRNGLDNSHLDSWEGNRRFTVDIRSSESSKDRIGNNQHNVVLPDKSGKASSLSMDKAGSVGLNSEGALETFSDQRALKSKRSSIFETETDQCHVETCSVFNGESDAKQTFVGRSSTKSGKSFNDVKRESRKLLDDKSENCMESGLKKISGVKLSDPCNKDASFNRQKGLISNFGAQGAKKISTYDECRNRKSTVNPDDEHKVLPSASNLASRTQNGRPLHLRGQDVSICNEVSKFSKDLGHVNRLSEHCQIMSISATDRSVVQNPGGPSLLRKESSCQSSTLLKEAESLRNYADNLKNSGFVFECNESYFQAALKFLHGASLLESSSENSKPGESNQMLIYSNTAKLCESCAHEYEMRQEMAAAALAYKCMEVAYMRVTYCKSFSANRHWHDLQASLQNVPQGESPSSSASDIDNLNNQAMVEKASLSKSNAFHSGSHLIAPRNRPNFVRLLDFTKDVNFAMEASKKSQNAFAAANVALEEAQNKEGIVAVKQVMDFSFQDVEEFVRLVRVAVKAISRQGFGGSRD